MIRKEKWSQEKWQFINSSLSSTIVYDTGLSCSNLLFYRGFQNIRF